MIFLAIIEITIFGEVDLGWMRMRGLGLDLYERKRVWGWVLKMDKALVVRKAKYR